MLSPSGSASTGTGIAPAASIVCLMTGQVKAGMMISVEPSHPRARASRNSPFLANPVAMKCFSGTSPASFRSSACVCVSAQLSAFKCIITPWAFRPDSYHDIVSPTLSYPLRA